MTRLCKQLASINKTLCLTGINSADEKFSSFSTSESESELEPLSLSEAKQDSHFR